jgi:hypothetical protein
LIEFYKEIFCEVQQKVVGHIGVVAGFMLRPNILKSPNVWKKIRWIVKAH